MRVWPGRGVCGVCTETLINVTTDDDKRARRQRTKASGSTAYGFGRMRRRYLPRFAGRERVNFDAIYSSLGLRRRRRRLCRCRRRPQHVVRSSSI